MARTDLRHPGNAAGDWFVDTRCIDCGTCRDVAPGLFRALGDHSVVARQPTATESEDAWLAAQACPTSSIGTISRRRRPGRLYPREIEPGAGVFDCGYCSEDSFGASAWLVRRPAGNVLVDSPRYTDALARPIAEMGGLASIVLTHRDDVADARRCARRSRSSGWPAGTASPGSCPASAAGCRRHPTSSTTASSRSSSGCGPRPEERRPRPPAVLSRPG